MRILLLTTLFLVSCGTRLSTTDMQAEQATRTISAAGFEAHSGDITGQDLIRFQAIYCSSSGILRRAGEDAGAIEGGPQCPQVSP